MERKPPSVREHRARSDMGPSDRRRLMEKAVANRFSLCKTHGLAKHTGWPGSSGPLGPFWALFGPFFFRWQWALVGVWMAQFRNTGSRKWAHFLGLGWKVKKPESEDAQIRHPVNRPTFM